MWAVTMWLVMTLGYTYRVFTVATCPQGATLITDHDYRKPTMLYMVCAYHRQNRPLIMNSGRTGSSCTTHQKWTTKIGGIEYSAFVLRMCVRLCVCVCASAYVCATISCTCGYVCRLS